MTKKIFAMTGTLATMAAALLLASAPGAQATEGATRTIDFESCEKPHYPEADLKAKHQGKVDLGFQADKAGTITASKVLKSSGYPSLDEAARTAIAKCKFLPAKPGKKYDEWMRVMYVWTLE